MVPAFLCSFYLTLYKTDTSPRWTLSAGPKGVRLRESWLYSLVYTLSFYHADLYWPSRMFYMHVSVLLSYIATSLLQIKRSSTCPKLVSSDNHAMVSKSQRGISFFWLVGGTLTSKFKPRVPYNLRHPERKVFHRLRRSTKSYVPSGSSQLFSCGRRGL